MEDIMESPNDCIRKIEDIIDIQKANGNYNTRQVAFDLHSETNSTISTNQAKSLESGLTKHKKSKKFRSKLSKNNILPDQSWPSDSDITVLRMKLCLTSGEIQDNAGNVIQGDGLHQPDSSSMINLATLINDSQPPSKQSLIEELLLPLTSWQRDLKKEKNDDVESPRDQTDAATKSVGQEYEIYRAVCSYKDKRDLHEIFSCKDSDAYSQLNTKSKFARFLRLYFCPCCSCLYKIEKTKD